MSARLVHNLDKITEHFTQKASDFSVPLKQFYVYMLSQTARTFRALGKKNSGVFRGVSWPWFSPIKTTVDGKAVSLPAEGSGKVKGKKRHSGKRVTAASKIMQDTGILRNSAMGRFQISPFQLVADTPTKYAADQQKQRPFVFVTEQDTARLAQMINKHLVS